MVKCHFTGELLQMVPLLSLTMQSFLSKGVASLLLLFHKVHSHLFSEGHSDCNRGYGCVYMTRKPQ